MELIIGGAHQGKLDWYHQEYGTDAAVAQGETVSLQTPPQQPVLNHLHLWVRRMVQEDPEHADLRMQTLLEEYLRLYPQAVILCDEIGCGVVPIDPQERQWRETVLSAGAKSTAGLPRFLRTAACPQGYGERGVTGCR